MEPSERESCNNIKRRLFEGGPGDDGSESVEMSSEENARGKDDKTHKSEDEDMPSKEGECVWSREFGEDERFRMFSGPLSLSEMKSYEFVNLESAFDSYKRYALDEGFNVRKKKSGRVKSDNDKVLHSFVCSRQGWYDLRNWSTLDRQRELRQRRRCGCKAEMRICLDPDSGRWNVVYLNDEHNHPLVEITETVEPDLEDTDAIRAIKYLYSLASADSGMYWRYKVGGDGLLSLLFWSDSTSQFDYQIFGDVLAIDTSYKMSKYNYQLVVFSGFNHHNNPCVFGFGMVSGGTKENYDWLLLQFLLTMKRKCPQTIITNGEFSLMNAVRCNFSQVRHKLCSSLLLRNAEMKVGHPKFTKLFHNCMLQDYEINAFEVKWKAMIDECGVNHIKWVQGIYEKKHLWATAYTRGKFFIGCSGSSRCEELLTQVDKFVHCRFSLYEVVKNINHCLEFELRLKVDNDLKFGNEEPVLKTELKLLEKSGSLVFTRHIFDKYQTMLVRSYVTKVLETKNTGTSTVFIVGEYRKPSLKWTVSFYPEAKEFRCSCFRMESFGFPCSHIIKVMIFLDMTELPKSLILNRWTKNAKDSFVDKMETKMNAEHGNSNRKRKVFGGETIRLGKKDGQLIGTSAQFEKHLGGRQ